MILDGVPHLCPNKTASFSKLSVIFGEAKSILTLSQHNHFYFQKD